MFRTVARARELAPFSPFATRASPAEPSVRRAPGVSGSPRAGQRRAISGSTAPDFPPPSAHVRRLAIPSPLSSSGVPMRPAPLAIAFTSVLLGCTAPDTPAPPAWDRIAEQVAAHQQ